VPESQWMVVMAFFNSLKTNLAKASKSTDNPSKQPSQGFALE
jgi:hypothetical protein